MVRFFASFLVFVVAARAQQRVDWILSAGHVVTMDDQRRVIPGGAIAVRGQRIVAVGTRAEIAKAYSATSQIHDPNALLIPGLINTHTHAPMVLLRGIADDRNLQEWLEKFIFPAEARNVTPEFVRWGTQLACAEMILGGTTTYADMYYFEEVSAEATKQCGMRGVLGQTIIGFPVPDAKTVAEGLARTEKFLKQFQNDDLIVPAIAPHAVYTNSDETLQASRRLADRYKAPLLIHLSETKRENDELQAKRTTTPTALLEKLGVLSGRTLAAHGTWISDADIKTLASRGTGVAHCPSSNMMLASGVAPVLQYIAAGVRLGVGTDGPAGSNNDLDMWEEMDLAAKLQKVSRNDPQALSARQAFELGTIGGARALGLETQIGSLEPGKRADLVFVNGTAPHSVPSYDVYSQLVYTTKAADVRHVFVNGKLLMRDRKLLTIDLPAAVTQTERLKQKIVESLKAKN